MIRSGLGGLALGAGLAVAGRADDVLSASIEAYASLAVSTVVAIAIGDTAFFDSTKAIGLGRAMTISMTYPLVAAGLARWLLGESITASGATGAVLTLAGLALIVGEPAAGSPAGAEPRGVALALLAALAWAMSAILMKPPLREVDPLTAQAVRLPVAAGVLSLTPWARGTARSLRQNGRASAGLLVALGALTALSSVAFVAGLKYAGVGVTTVLSSTSPLFALPIGLLAFGERVTWRAATGAALCVTGIALLVL